MKTTPWSTHYAFIYTVYILMIVYTLHRCYTQNILFINKFVHLNVIIKNQRSKHLANAIEYMLYRIKKTIRIIKKF